MATDFASPPAALQGSFGFHGTISSPVIPTMDSSDSHSSPVSHHHQQQQQQQQQQQIAHWFRLFVGWVPRHYTESNLKPIFDRSGDVKDIIILKDKVSGQPKGCAFVSYATEAEAERAIAELDRKIQLPGASSPMEVRFARSHQYIQAGTGPQDNRQLFFSRAPVGAAESQLKDVFEQFGEVEEVNIFADRKTNMSKGCGFIMMASREQALHAIEGLNEKYIIPGAATTLAVKWADPDLQSKKKKAVEEANSDKRTVMGGHKEVPPTFSPGETWAQWDGTEGNDAIAKWVDAHMQKKRTEAHPPGVMRPGHQNRAANGGRICRMPNTNTFYNVPPSATLLATQPHTMRRLDYTHDVPPLGCQSDAIKLFIGNIPKTYTAENLRPLFDRIGTVIELVVVRDKLTDESKGSAFVWYQSRCEAERAISELHLRHILHDPTGEQDRPLVVRRANPKAPPLLLQAAAVMPQTQMAQMPTQNPFMHQPAMMDSSLDFPEHLQGSFLPGILGVDQNPSASINRISNDFSNMAMQQLNSGRKMAPCPERCLVSKTQDVTGASDFLDLGVQDLLHSQPLEAASLPHRDSFDYLRSSDAFTTAPCSNPVQSTGGFQVPPMNQSMGSMRSNPLQNLFGGQMTLALPVTPQQGSVVGTNLHTIQAGSGALIQLAPGANDSYVVMLSGTEAQVNTAKTVVQELLASGMT